MWKINNINFHRSNAPALERSRRRSSVFIHTKQMDRSRTPSSHKSSQVGYAVRTVKSLFWKGTHSVTYTAEFATTCTPEHPLGATMVSTEGACAAYYRYRRVS